MVRVRCKNQGVHEGTVLHGDAPERWSRLDPAGVRYTPGGIVGVPPSCGGRERERDSKIERERGPGVRRYCAADVQYTLVGLGKYRGTIVDELVPIHRR